MPPDPREDRAHAKCAEANKRPAESVTVRQCLIVDDSRMIRGLSRRIAEGLGYTVLEGENGHEALTRCQMEMPDLILLDWDMPVMTGIEFVKALRALPNGWHPRVMFCTSKSSAQDIHKGIDAGADDWIVKPFDEPTMRTKLGKLLAD